LDVELNLIQLNYYYVVQNYILIMELNLMNNLNNFLLVLQRVLLNDVVLFDLVYNQFYLMVEVNLINDDAILKEDEHELDQQ